jgi:hypothetical protein
MEQRKEMSKKVRKIIQRTIVLSTLEGLSLGQGANKGRRRVLELDMTIKNHPVMRTHSIVC